MESNQFTLTEEQKKLCHELTMEYLRQNQTLKFNREEDKERKKCAKPYERIRNGYFSAYEEIAIGIHKNWDKIQGVIYM